MDLNKPSELLIITVSSIKVQQLPLFSFILFLAKYTCHFLAIAYRARDVVKFPESLIRNQFASNEYVSSAPILVQELIPPERNCTLKSPYFKHLHYSCFVPVNNEAFTRIFRAVILKKRSALFMK